LTGVLQNRHFLAKILASGRTAAVFARNIAKRYNGCQQVAGKKSCFPGSTQWKLQEIDRQMENKPAQNIQDSFLNTARKDKTQVTIYLLSGVKLTGRIRSFDKYSVVLETNNQEQLIFKHAISTVVMSKSLHHGAETRGGHHAAGSEVESTPVKAEG
jgi:host factor-I protein